MSDVGHQDDILAEFGLLALAYPLDVMVVDCIYNLGHIQRRAAQLGSDDFLFLKVVTLVAILAPGLAVLEDQPLGYPLEGILCVVVYLYVNRHVLVELGLVYIYVDNLGLGGVICHTASHAVGEPHSHRQDHIRLLGHIVGGDVAVHTYHTYVVRVVEVHCAAAQQGARHGDAGFVGAFCKYVFRTGDDYTLTGDDERLFCIVKQLYCLVYPACYLFRFIGADYMDHFAEGQLFVVNIVAHLNLGILGEADKHRTGTVAAGNVECLRYNLGNLRGLGNLIVPFGDGGGYTQHVCLLEKIGTQLVCIYLGGDADDGGGVHHGVCDAGHKVCGAGAAGGKAYAYLSRCTGISLCCVYGTLLVTDQDVVEPVAVVIETIVDGYN